MRPSLAPLFSPALVLLLIVAPLPAVAGPAKSPVETRLVLLGGGSHPPEAIARLVSWAGGSEARLLVVPWASGEPEESCREMVAELLAAQAGEAACAAAANLDPEGHARLLAAEQAARFLDQLRRATGVFFTGGDQARVMDVLADPSLLSALQARYAAGVVFGGTSAGLAIMSPRMITGDGDFSVIDGDRVGVRPGLGLLPGVILDQHFVKRQRENRLFGLVLKHPQERGVGVDEGAALLVTHDRHGEVVGGVVMVVDAIRGGRLAITLLRSGQKLDLRRRP